ncbi:hypothetical protein QN219_29270 [Sinorhizobium sp. 7-81]|uniref:hypothetical protein n=1 Tax=Sinorhizobium sp. 8-89 TaxID=3049089 RepID=UPI0024C380CC|nr:hypothetical protein [Sinorhizobium sp. 8-89]MDK1494073.1 hypothetical protein [Sinorhizobium sp. 8-89]
MAKDVAAKAEVVDLAANYRQVGLRAVLAALSIKSERRVSASRDKRNTDQKVRVLTGLPGIKGIRQLSRRGHSVRRRSMHRDRLCALRGLEPEAPFIQEAW